MVLAEFAALVLRAQRFPLFVHGVPDIQQRQEIRLRIGKALVRGRGGLLLLQRPLARVLDAQPGGNNEQLTRGMLLLRLQQHPAQRRIDGQARQIAAQRRQLAAGIQRAEFLQQRVAGLDARRAWAD